MYVMMCKSHGEPHDLKEIINIFLALSPIIGAEKHNEEAMMKNKRVRLCCSIHESHSNFSLWYKGI